MIAKVFYKKKWKMKGKRISIHHKTCTRAISFNVANIIVLGAIVDNEILSSVYILNGNDKANTTRNIKNP